MPDLPPIDGIGLEVILPDSSRQIVRITASPFYIGRGNETGNHLQLADRRISRHCATIISESERFYVEDRGHRHGIFVNGKRIDRCALGDGDVISFGVEDSYEIIFHAFGADAPIQNLLTRIEGLSGTDPGPGRLRKLNLLLEATMLLHSQLPLESVLSTMLDHSIDITGADRGLLLETDSSGSLSVRLARGRGGTRLSPESVTPSQTALRQALEQHSTVITGDLSKADFELQHAQSIVEQRLRAIGVIPLYAVPHDDSPESAAHSAVGTLLGVIYLDSRRPAAFSKIERQILDALATEAASILENAHLVVRERQHQRFEQELTIARGIQQALLPRDFRDFPNVTVTGMNAPCLAVGGDYFDVFPISRDRTAFLIADVSGKGLGAALLTAMLQGAISGIKMGADPERVFEHINSFLCEHAEVERYATIFFGIVDGNGRLDFINAGHPSPLLLRHGKVTEPFTKGSFPVGLVPQADYKTTRAEIKPGDTLILFSDGVTEAMDPRQEMFGTPRLREIIAGQCGASLDHLQDAVLESVQTFARGASQADDITLLLVRFRDAAQAEAARP